MAITKSFKLAELIRHIEYDSTNDIITTNKGFKDKNDVNSLLSVCLLCSFLTLCFCLEQALTFL